MNLLSAATGSHPRSGIKKPARKPYLKVIDPFFLNYLTDKLLTKYFVPFSLERAIDIGDSSNKLLFWRLSALVHNISTAECLRNVHLTAAWWAHVKYARDVVCSWREHERDSLLETDDGNIIVTSLFLNFCSVPMNNLFYIYIITYSSSYGYLRIRNWPAPECGFIIYSGHKDHGFETRWNPAYLLLLLIFFFQALFANTFAC